MFINILIINRPEEFTFTRFYSKYCYLFASLKECFFFFCNLFMNNLKLIIFYAYICFVVGSLFISVIYFLTYIFCVKYL